MKKVVLTPAPAEIDWSKRQWVQNIQSPSLIILTTRENSGSCFSGMALPCVDYPNGSFSHAWFKDHFRRLEGSIPFTISNED